MKKLLTILLFSLAFMVPHFAHADISTGEVGEWRFDTGSGSVGFDTSGNGNNLTLVNGVTWVTGQIGPFAESLNGSSQYAQLPSSIFGSYPTSGSTNTYDLSFSAWFKTTTAGVIFSQNDTTAPPSTPSGYVPAIYVDNSGAVRSSMFWHNDVSFQIVSPATTYADGNWHQVVDTYSSGVETLYIDGASVGSQTKAEFSYNPSYNYLLGTSYNNGWSNLSLGGYQYFNGSLDDVRVYNRALSAGDVTQLFAFRPATNQPSTVLISRPVIVKKGLIIK